MSKMIQIRDVPDQLHGTLKARAAREGMSLSDFLRRELEHTQQAAPLTSKHSSAQVLRDLRDAH